MHSSGDEISYATPSRVPDDRFGILASLGLAFNRIYIPTYDHTHQCISARGDLPQRDFEQIVVNG